MKSYRYTLSFLTLFCNLSLAQDITCASPEVLDTLNANVHDAALIRNTKLPPKSILDVSVSFSHISDSVARDGWLPCWAYGELEIDSYLGELLVGEDLKFSKAAKETAADYLPNIYSQPVDESRKVLTVKGFHYNIYMTPDGALKNIKLDGNDQVSLSIYGVAWFKQNIDDVKAEIAQNSYIDAYSNFTNKDRDINEIYNHLPSLIQERVRGDMRQWIKEKNDKCGKIESLSHNDVSTTEKINVYKCQTEMTEKQIEVLTQ